jgi:hypothetical protein
LIEKDLLEKYIKYQQFNQIIQVLKQNNQFCFLSHIINKLIEKDLLEKYINNHERFNEIIQVLIQKNKFYCLNNIINRLIEKDLLEKYDLSKKINLLMQIKADGIEKNSVDSAIQLFKTINKAYDKTLIEKPNQLQEQNQLQVQIKKSFSFKIFCLLNKKIIIRDLFLQFDKKLCDFQGGIKLVPVKPKPNQLQQL